MQKEPGAGGRQAHRVRAENRGKMEIHLIEPQRTVQAARSRLAGVCGVGGEEEGEEKEPEETLSFFSLRSLRLRMAPTLCAARKNGLGKGG